MSHVIAILKVVEPNLENSPYVNSIFILKHATPAVDMSSNKCNFFISKILGMLLVVSAIKFY